MNGSQPCGPSGDPQAPSPKRRRPRLRGVVFPPHPNPLPQERESARTALENSDIAIAVAAYVSLVSEAHDNEARLYHQSTGECFSLSLGPLGRGLGVRGERRKLRPQAWGNSRNCQASRVPRQSREFPKLIVNISTRSHLLIPSRSAEGEYVRVTPDDGRMGAPAFCGAENARRRELAGTHGKFRIRIRDSRRHLRGEIIPGSVGECRAAAGRVSRNALRALPAAGNRIHGQGAQRGIGHGVRLVPS